MNRILWTWIVPVAASLIAGYGASAAVYNFYFNNTEQGDNSTANPALTVQSDDKGKTITKQGADGKVETIQSGAPAALSSDAAAASVATAIGAASGKDPHERNFRFGLSWFMGHERARNYYTGYNDSADGAGGLASLAYMPSRYFNLGAAAGLGYARNDNLPLHFAWFAEAQFVPVHISTGSKRDLVEWSLGLGVTNLAKAYGNWMSAHAVTRLAFNFTDDFYVAGTFRANRGFYLTDVGAGMRF